MKSVLRKLSKRKLKEIAILQFNANLEERIERIRESVKRINILMNEVRKAS